MKAVFNDTIIAQSNTTIVVEGNHYFSPESVRMEYLVKTANTYTCPWKGVCDYYTVRVGDNSEEDAAWMYPAPKEAAESIAGRFAFWKGVVVQE